MTARDVSLAALMQKCFGERVSPAVPTERSLVPGVPSQSLHLTLCVSEKEDNFSFEHMEEEEGQKSGGGLTSLPLAGTRYLHFAEECRGGSAENSATRCMNQGSSLHPIAAGAPRYQAQCGAARVITAKGGAQLAGTSTPAVPLITTSGLCVLPRGATHHGHGENVWSVYWVLLTTL